MASPRAAMLQDGGDLDIVGQAPAVSSAGGAPVHLEKPGTSKTRPIGIPTLEDTILQRAALMVLEPVYEQDFVECSYGFRPGRGAHQALDALWHGLMELGGGWVIDLDIEDFFRLRGLGSPEELSGPTGARRGDTTSEKAALRPMSRRSAVPPVFPAPRYRLLEHAGTARGDAAQTEHMRRYLDRVGAERERVLVPVTSGQAAKALRARRLRRDALGDFACRVRIPVKLGIPSLR